ncbi:mitochondrial transcription factor B2 [Andrena cerasifolii]|uniref:mitochondrial transcription factor B2 n=1 Tax=Andrena cerasifolii TaxID=2819439 RepID=UPI004038051B
MPRTNESHNSVMLHSTKRINHTTAAANNTNSLEDKKGECYQIPTLLHGYLQTTGLEWRNNIPYKYLSMSTKNTDLYLINQHVAEQFVSLIKDDLLQNATRVIEMNPGLGMITKELLDNGVPFIHLYEKEEMFVKRLNNLRDEFPKRLSIEHANLYNISRMMNVDSIRSSNEPVFGPLGDVRGRKWEEPSSVQIIGATNKLKFIRHLILSTVFQSSFMMNERAIFYMAISPSIWHRFAEPRKVTSGNVMFQTIFNYKLFGSLERKAFLPWHRNRVMKNRRKKYALDIYTDDINSLYVVKLEPKPDLFTLFKKKQDLIHFWHFVRHNLYKPSYRVIPAMEKIMPGCGFDLIKKNYNIFTQFNDLTASQIYDLFMELQAWPEIKNSIFMSSAADVRTTYALYNDKEYDE